METVTTKTVKSVPMPPTVPEQILAKYGHFPLTDKEAEEWEKSQQNGTLKQREVIGAVVKELDSVRVSVRLNNGTHDGKVQTLNVPLGTLSTSGYDEQKAMNIVELLKPVLSRDVYDTQETKVSTLSTN